MTIVGVVVLVVARSILLRVKVGKDGMEYFDAGLSISEYRACGVSSKVSRLGLSAKQSEPRMGMEHIMEIVIEVLAGALDEADDNTITKLEKDTEIDGSTAKDKKFIKD
ncbi:hypothetical protein PPACK8108_LOCUS19424 [Phakopsora pachyrhizi]|uniref:Uncharacterized protein n=1 Tax=Phakopsora pachyrhizi TaxID=170000 RepID=A0AAV0BG01_PHAPC|nr:hypothetical protein PPACK8108_LOCUS19424 [Phakopsora pachyrhizi]